MEMIKMLKPYFSFPDQRGLIIGLCQEGSWKEVNIISSRKGTRRGDHYHKDTNELFIMLKGLVKVHLQSVAEKDRVMTVVMKANDAFIVLPNTNHTFEILEESVWINMLDRVVENDMLRME
jgi:dTDP-4-dehydrorhamnose 3,5-epimerase-like enzyme